MANPKSKSDIALRREREKIYAQEVHGRNALTKEHAPDELPKDTKGGRHRYRIKAREHGCLINL